MPFKSFIIKITLLLFCTHFSLYSYSQLVSFSYSSTSGGYCSPATIQFSGSATGNPIAYVWAFGNGATSTGMNASYTYNSPGTYTVKLTAIYSDSAVAATNDVIITPVLALNVTPGRNYICQPGNVTFTANGNVGTGTYLWDFGDNTTITTTTPIVTHAYTAMGNYTTTVKATSQSGCVANANTQVRIAPPSINGSVTPMSGCIPISINFNANVQLPSGASVSKYAWHFADTTAVDTTITNQVTHLYDSVGKYSVRLTIITDEGCTNTFQFDTIAFGTPPTNLAVQFSKDTMCASDTLIISAKATNANMYRWNFGDGDSTMTIDTFALHRYKDLLPYKVTVTPFYNGCPGVPFKDSVLVMGVIADFKLANTCTDKQTFTFTDISKGGVGSNRWTMGDGFTANNQTQVVHSYANNGTYVTRLYVYDSLSPCMDSTKYNVYIATPTMTGSDTLVCKGQKVNFTINNNYENPGAYYVWNIAGDSLGPIGNSNLVDYTPKFHGLYNNSVIIYNGQGYCPDTISQALPIRVRGPKMDFTAQDQICVTNQLSVTNNSAPFYSQDSIKLSYWNFGDRPTNDTGYQPQPRQYQSSGNFNVTVFAIDINNCKDSLTKTAQIRPIPFIITQKEIDTLCLGRTTKIFAFHTDTLRWTTTAGISCNTCDTITVSPTTTTYYAAQAINQFGCINTDSSLVKVYAPFTASTSFTERAICLGDSTMLSAFPTDKLVQWSPVAGLSSSTIHNPVATPTITTQYKAVLSDSVGCFSDSVYVKVITKTIPVVDAGPARTYPYYSTFLFEPTYSSNVASYRWSPGATLSCTNCAVPSCRIEESQYFKVVVTSDSGCTAMDSVKILIECKDAYLLMPTAFTPDYNGLNDYYYPLTRGISVIKNFAIYNRTGQLMFQAKDFKPNDKSFGWDGKFKGEPQPIGAYVFIMEALCDAGQMLNRKGSFLIMR